MVWRLILAALMRSQDQLATASKVAKATIANFEASKRTPYDRTLLDLQAALESAGVEFIAENGGGAGVRLKKSTAPAMQLPDGEAGIIENNGM
jgi:transcriptional regulator with XRE-family HTH domain